MIPIKIKRHRLTRTSSPSQKIKRFLKHGWWYLITLFLLLLALIAKQFPTVVENIFSRSWYHAIATTYGKFTSLLPLSILELIVYLLIILAIGLIIHGVRKWWYGESLKTYLISILRWIMRGTSLTVAVFMLFCGYNYYRIPFSETCGLTIRDSSAQELYLLCEELTLRANELRSKLPMDKQNAFTLAKEAENTFATLAQNYQTLPAYSITPKPVLSSWAMSMMQITGVFCPITFEANINISAPAYSVPATMCHELAHTRGFMREDEANFIAYLACMENDSVKFQYSGIMLALIHAQNFLYNTDSALFEENISHLSENVIQDFAYNNAYWAKFDGTVGKISTAVNDAYLQLNSQPDGVQSYGRMVDLLLADYRVRHKLN